MRKKIPVITNPTAVKEMVNKLSISADLDTLEALTQSQYSHNSLLAIYSDWRRYLEFCHLHHINVLPASITAVRRFLERESQHRKFASLKRYTATLSQIHTILGLPNPVNHRQIKFTLSQLRSLKGPDAKQTNAFTLQHLQELNQHLSKDKGTKVIRDLAIYSLMFECALKRSELKYFGFDQFDIDEDGVAQVTLSDKTYRLSKEASEYLSKWLVFVPDRDGAVFRSIDRHGNISRTTMNDSSIYRILRNASSLLQLPENLKFSGQSLRVGAVKELSKQGMKVKDIQDYGRWLSPAMPAQYLGNRSSAELEKTKFRTIKAWD